MNDCFKLLRKWNAEDPVSSEEMNRNEIAFQKQGNRNPFIDYPTFADRIWN
jgi:endonuclease I